MSAKHTPGPWELGPLTRGFRQINAVSQDQPWEHFASVAVKLDGIPSEEGEANVRLIAAAPQMLEALENLENDDGSIPEHAWNLVQSAIAKATGKEL